MKSSRVSCMLLIGTVFLEDKSSEGFPIKQEVAPGCALSPTLVHGLYH